MPRAAKLGKLKEMLQAFRSNLIDRTWENYQDLKSFLRSSGFVNDGLNAKLTEIALAEIQWKSAYSDEALNNMNVPPGLWKLLEQAVHLASTASTTMDYVMTRVKKTSGENRPYVHIHYCFASETMLIGGVRFHIDWWMLQCPEQLVKEVTRFFEKAIGEGMAILEENNKLV